MSPPEDVGEVIFSPPEVGERIFSLGERRFLPSKRGERIFIFSPPELGEMVREYSRGELGVGGGMRGGVWPKLRGMRGEGAFARGGR